MRGGVSIHARRLKTAKLLIYNQTLLKESIHAMLDAGVCLAS